MFYGTWYRRVDEKGRVAVVSRFKRELGKEVVVVHRRVSSSHSFLIFPKKEKGWKKFEPSTIWLEEMDIQDRIALPEYFRKRFSGRRAIWRGRGNYLEITILERQRRKRRRGDR